MSLLKQSLLPHSRCSRVHRIPNTQHLEHDIAVAHDANRGHGPAALIKVHDVSAHGNAKSEAPFRWLCITANQNCHYERKH